MSHSGTSLHSRWPEILLRSPYRRSIDPNPNSRCSRHQLLQGHRGRVIGFFELTWYMFPIGWLMVFLLWGFFMLFLKPENRFPDIDTLLVLLVRGPAS